MFHKLSQEFLGRIPVSKLELKVIENAFKEAMNSEQSTDSDSNILLCQKNILQATVFHPLNLTFPLPDSYIHNFLKKLISKIEEYSHEIHPELLEKYTDLITQSKQDQQISHRTYIIDESSYISLKESMTIISDGTTGLCTWQAAFCLAEWCLHNSKSLVGKAIVELGAGAGLVGITCYKMCNPKSVTMTDFHSKVLETLAYNLKINVPEILASGPRLEIEPLDWVEFSRVGNHLTADLVLASDVVYDVDLIPPLVGTLSKLLRSSDSTTAIVACTERNNETLNRFMLELDFHNLTYKQLEHAPAVFACERTYPVHIYEIVHSKQ